MANLSCKHSLSYLIGFNKYFARSAAENIYLINVKVKWEKERLYRAIIVLGERPVMIMSQKTFMP